jgi:hypothetical protein
VGLRRDVLRPAYYAIPNGVPESSTGRIRSAADDETLKRKNSGVPKSFDSGTLAAWGNNVARCTPGSQRRKSAVCRIPKLNCGPCGTSRLPKDGKPRAEYIDREGGAKADRKRFAAMMEAASRRQVDVLLFWSLDRFGPKRASCESLRVPPEVPPVQWIVWSELLYFDGATRRA